MKIRGALPNNFVYKLFEKELIFSRACFTETKLFHIVFAEHLFDIKDLSLRTGFGGCF